MGSLKKFLSKLVPAPIMSKYVFMKKNRKWKNKSAEEVFTTIYKNNAWGGHQSVSGRGSDDDQTGVIAREIPEFLAKLNIKSMLDIPCGDFHWMKNVDLGNVKYTGADIVADLVANNNKDFRSETISFEQLNLIAGPLPQVDLIFCRDCLVHFSYDNIISALNTVVDSNSAYLATTSFNSRSSNQDISTGNWRPLNLLSAPFNFPKPTIEVDEKCIEGNGAYADKTISIWKVSEIAPIIRAIKKA